MNTIYSASWRSMCGCNIHTHTRIYIHHTCIHTYIHTYIMHTYIHTYMFVAVNFDALAQASDIRIERRQVVFLCWMQDSNPPGSQTPNRQQTECPLTNRLSYRGSSSILELDSPSLWSASIQPTRPHSRLAFAKCNNISMILRPPADVSGENRLVLRCLIYVWVTNHYMSRVGPFFPVTNSC